MLASITGKITHILEQSIIVEVNSLGYGLFVTSKDQSSLAPGDEVSLYIYENVKEDAHDLYGFKELETKQMFEQLISVSGIGPKAGLAILSSYGMGEVSRAITEGDVALLTSVSGIGKKTAERIIVELRGKFEAGDVALGDIGGASDTLEALVQLGYSHQQAHQALSKVPKDVTDDEEKIRVALQQLGKA
ncbi:MAG: Holliday junction branch migration protein RuvA [Candidatus Saccharimonadales bacterium]